jgi:hypothetical protein
MLKAMKRVERERLPIECPNPKCTATGWVPIGQLDRQLVCRECGARFYLDRTGHQLVMGERPKVFADPLELKALVITKPDLAEKAFTTWDRLPLRVKKTIRAVLASALAVFLMSWVWAAYLRPAPKIPKDLNGRVSYLVKNVVRVDSSQIRPLILPRTEGDLKQWILRTRPKTWPKILTVFKVETKILYQSMKSKKACVEIKVDSPMNPETEPQPVETANAAEGAGQKQAPGSVESETHQAAQPPDTPPRPKPVVFRTFWTLDGDQGWLLDAAESLRNAG